LRGREWAIASLGAGAGLNAVKILLFGALLEGDRTYASGAFDPNETAALFVVGLPMMLHVAVTRRGVWRYAGGAMALMLAVAIVKTGSRGGFLGLSGLFIWLTATAPRKRRGQYVLGVLGCVVAFAAAADEATWKRFLSTFATEEDYNFTVRDGRIETWKRGVGYMITHPVLGVGVSAFPIADGTLSGKQNEGRGIKYNAAHNSFVEIGAELGFPGLIAFVTAWVMSMMAFLRLMRLGARGLAPPEDANFAACMAAGLVGWGMTSIFLSLAFHAVTLLLLACGSAAAVLLRRNASRLRDLRGDRLAAKWAGPRSARINA
jgi:O-antigen ligase